MKQFPPKLPNSHIVLSFDCAGALTGNETLTAIVSVNVSVNAGRDDAPNSILVPDRPPEIQGSVVCVPVRETRADYRIVVIVDTSNVDKRLELCALLPLERY